MKKIWFGLFFGIISCGKFEFAVEKEIELGSGNHVPVIYSVLKTGQIPEANLRWSVDVQTAAYPRPISNAAVTLYRDGLLFDTFRYEGEQFFGNRIPPIEGLYEMRISIPDFGAINAETAYPERAVVQSLVFSYESRTGSSGNAEQFIAGNAVLFIPKSASKFALEIDEVQPTSQSWIRQVWWSTSSPVFREHNSAGQIAGGSEVQIAGFSLFTSRTISDSLFQFSFEVESNYWQNQNTDFNFKLHTLDEAHYTYLQSVITQRNTRDNPFAEPQDIQGNFSRGVGIFGTLQTDRWTFSILPTDGYIVVKAAE
jgi:hypothetical protein